MPKWLKFQGYRQNSDPYELWLDVDSVSAVSDTDTDGVCNVACAGTIYPVNGQLADILTLIKQ